MSWLKKDIKDIQSFIPESKKIQKFTKSQLQKRGGIIAYKKNGDVFIVLQNVMIWSFPKGHFDPEKDETTLDTAIREFTEETGYSHYIDPERLTRRITNGKTTLYLFEMTDEEANEIPKKNRKYFEVILGEWINIHHLDAFRNDDHNNFNKTISDLDIPYFLKLSGISKNSFGKKRKSISKRKSNKKRKSVSKRK